MCPLLFYGSAADKSCLMSAVISGYNKVYSSVYTDNITDVGNITFLNIICDGDMQIVFTVLVYKLGSTEFVD